MSKVIKIEDIDQPGITVMGPNLMSDRLKTDRTGSMLAYGTDSSLLPTRGNPTGTFIPCRLNVNAMS